MVISMAVEKKEVFRHYSHVLLDPELNQNAMTQISFNFPHYTLFNK
jgi:hypothetical protein